MNIIVCMCHMILFLHQREQTALSCDNHSVYDVYCITILFLKEFIGGAVRDIFENQMIFECVVNVVLNDQPIVKFSGILYSLFF